MSIYYMLGALGVVLAILFVLGMCKAASEGDKREGRDE